MKPVLTLVQENLARLEAAKAKIATELSAKELEYKKSIEQFAASYEAVEANIAEYEAMRSRFIAELHKAIRLKLISIICEKFTQELLADNPYETVEVYWLNGWHGYLGVVYDRVKSMLRIDFTHRNSYTNQVKANYIIANFYGGFDSVMECVNDYHMYNNIPYDTEDLIALCSLFGIESKTFN